MNVGSDVRERIDAEESFDGREFGLERILAYAISAIGLCLVMLKLMTSP